MLLMIDNYDSFTYNLVQMMASQGADIEVFRNDQVRAEELVGMHPDALVVSPGPCTPKEAGISVEAIKSFAGLVPILGVCLGHQCIGAAFGGEISGASRIMHGKISMIDYEESDLYRGLKKPFPAVRSVLVEKYQGTDLKILEVTCNL